MNIPKSRFTEMLIEANGLDPNDFGSWVFCPGMLFRSPDKWWGDHGRRDFPHEGIDFCLYADRSGKVLRLDHRTSIPVIRDGVVRALFTDYLGQAVIVEHENSLGENQNLLSIYAHTRPQAGIVPGSEVKEGQPIATIADTSRAKANILAHLHFTLGLPSSSLRYEPFEWNLMRDPEQVTLLDPQDAIDWPCQLLDRQKPICLEL